MWMVGGYNESSHHHHHHHHHPHPQVTLGPHDAFNAAATRKLRPLIPRPPVVFPASTSCASAATTHSCNFGLYTGSDLFSLNHPLATGGGGDHQGSNKNKELSNINGSAVPQVVLSTSRWNPTPEQLRTLEDLYRRGTRTPSTEQIQRITAELRRYGKIEGKNVFYWFQNHKARERQKRRRELELLSHDPNQHHHEPVAERKERGPANGKQGFEGEQTRSHYSIASATHAQEAGGESMQRAAAAAKAGRRAAAAAVSDHRSRHNTGRLFHLDLDDELNNATWNNLVPSSSTPFCYSASTSPPSTPSMATCDITRIGTKTRRFIPSLKEPIPDTTKEYEADEVEEGSATLQLFPLRSQVESEVEEEDKSKERDVRFFEFLPPKIN